MQVLLEQLRHSSEGKMSNRQGGKKFVEITCLIPDVINKKQFFQTEIMNLGSLQAEKNCGFNNQNRWKILKGLGLNGFLRNEVGTSIQLIIKCLFMMDLWSFIAQRSSIRLENRQKQFYNFRTLHT